MSFCALYTGASGMIALGNGMQSISNNLANVNTTAFKEQLTLFQDFAYTMETTPSNLQTNFSQLGHGVNVADVSTRFYENGGFQSSNEATDLAISGSGFFQVTQGDKIHYTRSGNFRLNKDGELVDASGFVLSARPIENGRTGELQPAVITPEKRELAAKPTTAVKLGVNIGSETDKTVDVDNPFFSLAQRWNGAAEEPISSGAASFTNDLKVYDSTGKSHRLTLYADTVTTNAQGLKVYEYVVGMNPAEDARNLPKNGAGLLMAGNLVFSPSGQLMSMSAYVPTEGSDPSDLSTWVPAQEGENGPAMNVSFVVPSSDPNTPASSTSQSISLDLGLGSQWDRASGSPAAIGTDVTRIPGYDKALNPPAGGSVASGPYASTAYEGSSGENYATQNGYAQGHLVRVAFTEDGTMRATYSNNITADLFQVPLFNFIGVQNLQGEGMNHFTPTPESGEAIEGVAGTENFGKIYGNSLELSNVDMARQMAQMIITQRGFQFNSKTIQTADSMLQKAMELKR